MNYPAGTELNGIIVNRKPFGLFVEPNGMTVAGLVHKSCLPADFQTNDRFSPEEKIRVKVEELDPIRKRLALKYVGDAV